VNFDFHNITGFDISKWQGAVSFQKMKAGGASFVIVKAGQGNWADPMFETNWRNAKGVLPRSSYWYYDNRYPPDAQARKYFDILRGDLEGMCWLDLEDRSTGVYKGWQGWYDFLEEFKAVYPGAKIGIYSNFYYIIEMLSFATKAQRDYFGQYPLWLANYGLDAFHPAYSSIMVPLPWLECLILQSGTPAIGLDAGVESLEIDYNQFSGDANKFASYFKLTETPGGEVMPPQEGNDMAIASKWRATWGAGCNKRIAPNVSNTPIGMIPTGAEFEALDYFIPPGIPETQERWGKLVDGSWVALIYSSQPRAELVAPPPEPADEITVSVEADITATVNGKAYHGVVMFDNVQLLPVE
jgi:hypothetical protein